MPAAPSLRRTDKPAMTSRAGPMAVVAVGRAVSNSWPTMSRASPPASNAAVGRLAATVRPWRITVTRSLCPTTSRSLWVIRTTLRPAAAMLRTAASSDSAS